MQNQFSTRCENKNLSAFYRWHYNLFFSSPLPIYVLIYNFSPTTTVLICQYFIYFIASSLTFSFSLCFNHNYVGCVIQRLFSAYHWYPH